MEPLDKSSLIRDAIRRAILDQALAPGDTLPEDTLGERFGVSRTLARHALAQLASEGLVELRRNRMAIVAMPSFEDARDEFDIRIQLERLVVDRLCGKLDAAQLAELRAHVDEEERSDGNNGGKSAIRLATEFHVKLAEMTGKGLLTRYVREIAYRSCLSLATFGRPHSSECAISEHRALIDALEKNDAEQASALMSDHLEQVAGRAFLKVPERRGDLMEVLAPYAVIEKASPRKRMQGG
jgi:DNA-binding GntR family transcriptional regulator